MLPRRVLWMCFWVCFFHLPCSSRVSGSGVFLVMWLRISVPVIFVLLHLVYMVVDCGGDVKSVPFRVFDGSDEVCRGAEGKLVFLVHPLPRDAS